MGIKVAVFVTLISQEGVHTIVEAENGGGVQPFVRFAISNSEAPKVHVGKKYMLTVEEAE